jgi:dipeptidyl aminopeptidase/acylaminoacyl peptidase
MVGGWMKGAALAAALFFGAYAPQVGAEERPPLSAYSAMPAIELMEISPVGDRLARITVVGEERAIVVTNVTNGQHLAALRLGDSKVRDLLWIGQDRVLIIASRTQALPILGVGATELYFGIILDIQAQKLVHVLDQTDGVLSALFGWPSIRVTEHGDTLFVRGASLQTEQIDLYRINLDTGRGRSAARMDWQVQDYVLDASGQVIAMARYDDRRRRWTLEMPMGRTGFRDAWVTDAPVDTPSLLGLGRTPRTIIVNAHRPDLSTEGEDEETGFSLFEVNVDTGEWTPLRFEHHPDGMLHHPETHLLIGATREEEDGAHHEFLDPVAARRWASIERAFAGQKPRLVSWNNSLRQVVVFTDIGESGRYQIVDFDRGEADILADAYPAIPATQIGATRPIRYKAGDGLDIHGYLTLPPGVEEPSGLPLVVLAHGGPAARDTIGFDWWTQAMASRGYAVLQANFRGSTGYGRDFREAGYGEWGRKMQTDLSDGVRWLAEQGLIDPERVCIVGASYGGYAAMAGPTLDQGVYRCAVSFGGVSDLRRMVNHESREGGRRDNQSVRYWNRFMGAERLNDRGLDALSPALLAAQADAPILLMHGRDDTVVPIEQSRVMAEALRRAGKPYEFIELSGEDHWLSRAETRERMLVETVRFLEAHNPPR